MKRKFGLIYIAILIFFSIYVLLDTFVIKKVYQEVNDNNINNTVEKINNIDNEIISTDNYYYDDNIEITLTTYRENDTTIYVADIIADSNYLKTAFANQSYGKNVTDKTSNIANSVNAILAINGDYYGVQESGYVLKDGVIYRSTTKRNQEDLVIYQNGNMEIINENDISLEELLENGAYNILSFGLGLINNNSIIVSTNDEVDKSMRSNPRTALGMMDENHYVFVVSDGRTSKSIGLSLYELATFMQKLGCQIAYNLDGGSSTMYFNGNIINNPTTNGRIRERSVSDIVYIGY